MDFDWREAEGGGCGGDFAGDLGTAGLTDTVCFHSIAFMNSPRTAGFIRLAMLLCALPLTNSVLAGELESTNLQPEPHLSEAQRDFMKWRFGLFLHFNLGTFADLDWAGGYEDPALFKPGKLDCGQ